MKVLLDLRSFPNSSGINLNCITLLPIFMPKASMQTLDLICTKLDMGKDFLNSSLNLIFIVCKYWLKTIAYFGYGLSIFHFLLV